MRAPLAARPLLALAAAALLLPTPGCRRLPPASERSILLVTLDTTRADRIGAFGGSAVPTPSLDAVAREGAVFEEAISQVPLTLPAHASIFTGRYPASHGVRHNGIYRLADAETTLAEALRGAGYRTAAFVAAFVVNRGFGLEQGFESYDDVPVNRYQGGRDQVFEAQRTADAVNERVDAWLAHRPRGKFFVWVHYYDPHDPYEPPEKPGRTLSGSGYDREISYVDACFGDLVRRLADAGLLDETIVVVAGDHGESLGEHGEKTHGLFLYEGAVHVPLLVRAPGLVPAGARVRGPVELVDVAPTVLDLAGLPPLEGAQGRSLRPRWMGQDDGQSAVAHAETLMPRLEFGWSELRMIRDARFKYVQAPTPELYDLGADRGEARNLEAEDRATAARMRARLDRWVADTATASEMGSRRELSPDEAEALRSLGYLQGGVAGEPSTVAQALPDPKDRIPEVRELDEARDRLRAGDAEGALEGVDRVLRRNPGNHSARSTRILVLLQQGRLPEAEAEARAALAAAESDRAAPGVLVDKARALLASVFHLGGKRAEAEDLYRRLLRSDPRNEPIAVDLARLLLEAGRGAEAATILDEVLAGDPRNGMALAARFLLEADQGRREAAIATAEALAEARAGDPPVLVRAGRLLLEAGRPASAAACFETAQEQQVRPDPELLGQIGTARLAAGRLAGAREAFLAASRLEPADPRPHYYLGNVALAQGDEAAARESFRLAMERDPRFVAPLVSLGRWLDARGRRDEALQTLQEAVARNPGDPKARQTLEAVRSGH